MTPIIEVFIDKINNLNLEDYESFERAAIHALNKLQTECHRSGIYDVDSKVNEIRNALLTGSNFESLFLRNQLFLDAEYLDQLIMAHQQDWESPQNFSH
jgi:hypothetical protein